MIRIHPTAEVSAEAEIGDCTSIWHYVQIREGVCIGSECIIGKNVYVDFGVQIGNRVKIQNNCSVYHGAELEDGVFLGPHVVLTNDTYPRAINPDGTLKGNADWEASPIHIGYGAAVGACSVILPGVTVGRFAVIGAGAVVTRDVPPHGLVVGNPARLIGHVCACGRRLTPEGGAAKGASSDGGDLICSACGARYAAPPAA